MRRDKLFGNMFMRLAACALMVFACAGEVWGIGNTISKPRLNPAFVKWQHEQKNQKPQANKASVTNVRKRTTRLLASTPEADADLLPLPEGLVPTMVDFSYLNSLNNMDVRSVSGALQASYDPRDKGLTPVRHQDPQGTGIGTCWAQASIGSMETWLKVKGYGLNQFSVKNMVNREGWDSNSWYGGNFIRSSAYLLRWDGPVWESDDPYTNKSGIVNYSLSSPMLSPVYHVQQTRLVPARTGALDNDALKKAIMEFGGLYATMKLYSPYYSGTSTLVDYWSDKGGYCCTDKGAGHAVTLVGWDDTYSKTNFNSKCRPVGNGAWIVKDSYGVDLPRDNGYIYVSYYDTTFAYTTSCAFPLIEGNDNYGNVYQYDEFGQVRTWGIPANPTQVYTSGYGANMFAASQAEELAAVGFYATIPNAAYKIRIYTGCDDASNPSSGTFALEQSGTVDDYAGFYTVPLKNTVAVEKGSRFAVVLMLSTPGAPPFSLEIAADGLTSNAIANAGESFFSLDGSNWYDFNKNANLTYGIPANFCLKAYTKSATASKPTLSSIAISGASSLISGETATFKCEATYSDGSKKTITPTWSITEGRNYATVSPAGLVTAKSVTAQQRVTVKASYTEDGVTTDATWGFYVTIAAPSVPIDVTATQGTDTSCIHVNWTAPAGATEYAVYRAAVNNIKNVYHLENVNVAKYHDTGSVKPIVPGVDYWYFIKAKNSSGTSGFSAGMLGWRKLSPPDAETIKASDNLTDRVTISWGEVEGATHYRVYRADDVDGEKQAISGWLRERTFDDVPPEKDVPYCYYVVAAVDASGNRPSDYSIFEDGMMVSPVTVDHLEIKGDASIASGGYADYTADAIYTDRHRVENVSPVTWTVSGDGATVSGNRVTAATVTENKKVVLLASYTEDGEIARGEKQITIAAVKPNTPTGVTAGLVSQGVTITWSAVSGAVSYKVYRADSANAVATQIGMTAGTSYPDTSAMPGVAYTYSVSAVNGAGESERSGGVVVTVPLAVPTGVTASSDRTDGVLVSWQTVNGASYYRVARAMSATGAKTDLGSWQTGTSYLDTSATAGTMYWYFVRAATSSGGANASGYSASAQGVRKVPVTLSSISIFGPDKVSASKTAMYTCTATYSDGTSKSVSPTWSVSGAATIDANGKLTANAVSANSTATVVASFTDGTTKTANKAVTVIAPIRATAEVRNINVASRWPFSSLLDIDYELVTDPASAKAMVNVIGRDEDHNVDMAAKTLSGDGANGSYVAAGQHRLTWNIGADYTNFHAKAFSVTITAAPSIVGVPENVTVSASTSGVTLNWSAVEDATGYEVWRGTGTTTNGATKIATVTGATTYFDGTGTAGTTYRYWLRASGEDGMGEFSQPVTGTSTVIVPTSLVVSGASSVTAGGTATYSCTVTRNDGTSGTVTPTWSITSGSSYASISSSGVLTVYGTATQRSVTIQASYTQNGTTKTATKSVTINTKSVTIYFNGNGGTASTSSRSYTAYGTYGSLPTATRSGYTFAGWWTASSGGTQVTTSSTVPSAGTTLYAHWTAISSFGLVLDDALRNYAAFEAWSCALYLGVTNTLDSVEAKSFTPGSNVYIHFAWQNIGLNIVSNPTVKLEVFSSTMSLVATASATSNIELESGYATYITGWTWGGIRNLSHGSYILKLTLDPDCLIEDVDREDNVLTYGFNVDATGLEYGVILDQQGGSGGTTSIAAVYGSAMPTITVPTRTGYAFGGYYTATSGSGTQYYSSSGASARAWDKTSDTTLYAKWTPCSYVLSVNPNGGTLVGSNFGAAEGTSQQTSVNVTYDALYYYDLGTATRSGYTFDGWWTSATGGEKVYNANGLAVTGSRYWNTSWQWQYPGSLTIYAHWTSAGNTVTLNKQSGSGGTSSVTATYGSAMPSITVPTRTGYAFGGYYTGTNGSGTQYYTASGTSARTWDKTSDTTLYAKWTASTCTVTLNKQSGSGGTSSVTATYGSSMPSITVPSRSGYIFGGYYTSTNGGGTQYYTSSGASARTWDKTSATTLYAKWTANSVRIIFDNQGGTSDSVPSLIMTPGDQMMPCTPPTRQGFTFGGYYTSKLGGGTKYYDANGYSTHTCDLSDGATLYAKWSLSSTKTFMVIDLSSGSSATSYGVTFLDSAPSGGWTSEYKTTKLVLRRISAGSFSMGSPSSEMGRYSASEVSNANGYQGNEVQHTVTISTPIWVGLFEVTQRQWELVMGNRPSYFANASYYAARPVEKVSWEMIRGSSSTHNWPNKTTVDSSSFMGLLRSRTACAGFDLPTEAQWEYACRAGTTTGLNTGWNLSSTTGSDSHMASAGRYYYNSGCTVDPSPVTASCTTTYGTAAVGTYSANNWGLYDMHGNVMELCLDWMEVTPASSSVTDPKGPSSGTRRVARGGCHTVLGRDCRSAARYTWSPSSKADNVGFRVFSSER